MREFAFELSLCAHLEDEGGIVARQLGGAVAAPGSRILDIVHVEAGPEFDARAAITPETIPARAIEAAVGVGRARPVNELAPADATYARAGIERAVDVGFFKRERRGGREYVRQTTRYPDEWFSTVTAIENKPDLSTPGDLERQLRFDVSLGLVDRVVLATGSYVTRAHLNRIPEPVGVWRFVDGKREVIREPQSLNPGDWGVELREQRSIRTDVSMVPPGEKARKRRRIAERAYGKGWRVAPPACAEGSVETHAGASVPYCTHYDRIVDPGECGPSCPGYEPDDPPAADLDDERDRRTPWIAEPAGTKRRQAGLDRFR
ncbi:DUF5787 family protein [Halalkalicoccus subterraneus]|uniref:DUF5787 family protein n=1 Tax=Halalkalicoccus subterraneus TaxID=2675002 RepID=UPI000EFD9D89|nr:DUF5787 family protein [Halalkalicoccus subterraneus]